MVWCSAIRSFFREDVTVEPVVFLYLTAIFMETSITQDLMFTKICLASANVTSVADCRNDTNKQLEIDVKEETTVWIRNYSGTMFVFTILAASYIGSWSDRFSRKYTMLIPPIGSVLSTIVAIANGANLDWKVNLLLISAFLSGVSGGITAILASSFGYIADVTTPEKRTQRIVILESMIYLAAMIGMSCGGALNKYLEVHQVLLSSYAVVYLVEMSLLLLCIFYILFFIHDSTPPGGETPPPAADEKAPSLFYQLFNAKHIVETFIVVFKPRQNHARLYILLLMTTVFLVFSSLSVQQTLLYLFTTTTQLNWSADMYSYYSATSFGVSGVALILGLPLAFHFFKVKDTTFGMLGIFSKMAGLILLGFSTTTPLAYMCTVLFIFSEYPVPAIRSILSKIVEPDEKGKVFAFVQLLQNLSFLLGSFIFIPIFNATSFFPGLSFEIVAIFQAIALGILFFLHHKMAIFNVSYETMPVNSNEIFNEDCVEPA